MSIRNVQDYYDKTAHEWAEKWYNDDAMLPLLSEFMKELPCKPRMLDLCCGAGYESMRMARLGADVVGIDFSGECIRIARDRNPEILFYEDDMLCDYGYIGKVDAVVCIAGLVHLPVDKLRKAFERMGAVLKDGGQALFIVREGIGRQSGASDVVVDGELYDREFFAHTREELSQEGKGIFVFKREIPDEEPSIWKNYVFQKV